MKLAEVRFYFDSDILGLAKVVAGLRFDVTYPGDPGAVIRRRARPACPIERTDVHDDVWIGEVSSRGWLIVTRDRHIRDHRAEIAAVRNHNARLVTLASRDALSTWDQLEVLMTQWRPIQRLFNDPGPFIYAASRTSLRRVAL